MLRVQRLASHTFCCNCGLVVRKAAVYCLRGCDYELPDKVHVTPLNAACKNESVETVKMLLQHRANIMTPDRFSGNCLFHAIETCNPELVQVGNILDLSITLSKGVRDPLPGAYLDGGCHAPPFDFTV